MTKVRKWQLLKPPLHLKVKVFASQEDKEIENYDTLMRTEVAGLSDEY